MSIIYNTIQGVIKTREETVLLLKLNNAFIYILKIEQKQVYRYIVPEINKVKNLR